MKGRIVLITGASDGIGKKAAEELAKLGANLILHGRNREKTQGVVDLIRSQVPEAVIDIEIADLSSFDQIDAMTQRLHHKYDRIDVLVNNAGVQLHDFELSEDGYENTLAINHLAYFLITSNLIDLVARSDYSRIVNVASGMHYRAELDFDNLQAEKGYSLYPIYAQSKLCNVMFTYYLADKLQDSRITVNTLHPGMIDTNLNPKRSPEAVARALPVEQGIISLMRCVTDPQLNGITGKYFDSDGQQIASSDISYNRDLQEKLWNVTEAMVGKAFAFPDH